MTSAAPAIVPIVEGPGDVKAAPVLLRRVLHERMGKYHVAVKKPKLARGKPNLSTRFEEFLGHAKRTPGCAAILVMLDADKDCPKELGAQLAQRARDAGVGVPIAVVCAKREYENWFLASDEGFTGDVEEYSGAKEWLTHKTPRGLAYKATRHQPSLSGTMDIDAALKASRSFQRLCSALEQLVCCIDTGTVSVTPCP